MIGAATVPVLGHLFNYNFEFYDFSDPLSDAHSFVPFGSIDAIPYFGPQTFTKTVALRGAFLTENVSILLDAPGIYDGSVDFLHTATVAISAPPGVTFTSDSGVFLTAPEPGATPIGAAGVVALSVLSRRRSRLS